MQYLKKFQKKLIYLLVLAGFILKLGFIIFRSKKIKGIYENFQKFINEEKKEAEEFIEGEETLDEYCKDSSNIFKDYFIPYECNDHKPKILRTKPLAIIVILLLLLKVSVTGYLFFVYPNKAEMQTKITSDVLALVNEDRVKNGLAPLTINSILSASASLKADDMLNQNYFAHYSPVGKSPWDFVNRSEYPYLLFGENLAMNFSSAKSAHKALMNSESHKKNILNGKYNEIGLAVTTGQIDGKDTNVLVQFFAKRNIAPTQNIALAEEKPINETKENVAGLVENDNNIAPTTLGLEKIVPEEVLKNPAEQENLKTELEQESIKEAIPEDISEKVEPELVETDIVKETKTQEENVQIIGQTNEVENNLDIQEASQLNNQIVYYDPEISNRENVAAGLVSISKYIYIAVLIFMIIALALNIFIKLSIQHKLTIIQTVFVIVLIIGLLSIRLHMLENIVDKVAVL